MTATRLDDTEATRYTEQVQTFSNSEIAKVVECVQTGGVLQAGFEQDTLFSSVANKQRICSATRAWWETMWENQVAYDGPGTGGAQGSSNSCWYLHQLPKAMWKSLYGHAGSTPKRVISRRSLPVDLSKVRPPLDLNQVATEFLHHSYAVQCGIAPKIYAWWFFASAPPSPQQSFPNHRGATPIWNEELPDLPDLPVAEAQPAKVSVVTYVMEACNTDIHALLLVQGHPIVDALFDSLEIAAKSGLWLADFRVSNILYTNSPMKVVFIDFDPTFTTVLAKSESKDMMVVEHLMSHALILMLSAMTQKQDRERFERLRHNIACGLNKKLKAIVGADVVAIHDHVRFSARLASWFANDETHDVETVHLCPTAIKLRATFTSQMKKHLAKSVSETYSHPIYLHFLHDSADKRTHSNTQPGEWQEFRTNLTGTSGKTDSGQRRNTEHCSCT